MDFRMSAKELDRLTLMREIEEGQLSQGQASKLLGVSERQVRRIVGRFRREGAQGLIHRSRGRPSNRKLGAQVRASVGAFIKEEDFHDFGPTLLSETGRCAATPCPFRSGVTFASTAITSTSTTSGAGGSANTRGPSSFSRTIWAGTTASSSSKARGRRVRAG